MRVETYMLALIVINLIVYIGMLFAANKIDKMERFYKKYGEYIQQSYERYMEEEYRARNRYPDAPKYAPGGPEDRL